MERPTMRCSIRLPLCCAASLVMPACVDEDVDAPTNYETGEGSGGVCGAALQDGDWDGALQDWSDPGEPGDPLKDPPYQDILPHHSYMTAVHAAHLPSGELILFHGQGEQRLWPIGYSDDFMRWHPLPFTVPQANPDLCSYVPPTGGNCYADLFCSGHVVLPDGRFFVAGGNVDGSPDGGGLVDTFMFDPVGADPEVAPFGWVDGPNMAVDRWYPTLTVIPGANPATDAMGRVLISSAPTARPAITRAIRATTTASRSVASCAATRTSTAFLIPERQPRDALLFRVGAAARRVRSSTSRRASERPVAIRATSSNPARWRTATRRTAASRTRTATRSTFASCTSARTSTTTPRPTPSRAVQRAR